jgi:hypothetical protein
LFLGWNKRTRRIKLGGFLVWDIPKYSTMMGVLHLDFLKVIAMRLVIAGFLLLGWLVQTHVCAAEPEYVLMLGKDATEPVRKNADYSLIINAEAVTAGGKVDEGSKAWEAIRDGVSESLGGGMLSSLHVRFYYSDPSNFPDPDAALRKAVKRQLADLEVHVVWIDGEWRNDKKPWKERLIELKPKALKKPPEDGADARE